MVMKMSMQGSDMNRISYTLVSNYITIRIMILTNTMVKLVHRLRVISKGLISSSFLNYENNMEKTLKTFTLQTLCTKTIG